MHENEAKNAPKGATKRAAKIVSLVPSWTETFIEAGLNVVGRTRFCIHPGEKIKAIPAIGGTKNPKLEEILALQPDFVVLDKEENNKEIADALAAHKIEIVVSHVYDIESAAVFLEQMALNSYADRYRRILASPLSRGKFFSAAIVQKNSEIDFTCLDYVIWKNPCMVIGRGTFIADVFKQVGVELSRAEKYPVVEEEELRSRYLLLSTEPYPFAKEFEKLTGDGLRCALIDGEKISWYGIRNLRFLESCLQ